MTGSNKKFDLVVFDIDGTLSDPTHRIHYLENAPKNWDAFYGDMHLDIVHDDIVSLLRLFYDQEYTVVLASGRPDNYKTKTIDWLNNWDIPFDDIFMRTAGDFRGDDIVKVELLNQIREQYWDPYMWFDDRDRVVQAIRNSGVRCMQVREGNF